VILPYSEDVIRLNPELAEMMPKGSKYRNVRTFAVDRTFDSGLEAVRAGELNLLLKAKEIFCLCFQVHFPLKAKIDYVADFVYLDKELRVHVEDTKGYLTKEYKIKKKLFEDRYGIEIEEVSR